MHRPTSTELEIEIKDQPTSTYESSEQIENNSNITSASNQIEIIMKRRKEMK